MQYRNAKAALEAESTGDPHHLLNIQANLVMTDSITREPNDKNDFCCLETLCAIHTNVSLDPLTDITQTLTKHQ